MGQERGMTANGVTFPFGSDENLLKVDSGDSCAMAQLCHYHKKPRIVYSKRMICRVWEEYQIKLPKKKKKKKTCRFYQCILAPSWPTVCITAILHVQLGFFSCKKSQLVFLLFL